MSNTDSWWKKFVKFFTPLPKEELRPKKVKEEVLEKAIEDAAVVLKKFDDELQAGKIYDVVKGKPKRARTKKGTYKGDDKSTPDVNEAWEGGKAPKKKASTKKPVAKKTKVTRIKKKK
jgi:hypothetical protein|tara:strand:- start:172 stop:525 length:354 start_codon:yes stop_codon:yes gene_type:complete